MTDYNMVVLTNAVEGREDEYNAWYDGRHLDDVLKMPGFVRARRFVHDDPMATEPAAHKYLAIYEIESDDIAATFGKFMEVAGTDAMPISPALAEGATPMVYRAMGKVVNKKTPS